MARASVKVYRQTRRDREAVLINEFSVFDNYGRRITSNWIKRFIRRAWPKEGWWESIAGKSIEKNGTFTVMRPIKNGWERMYFTPLL